MNSLDLINNAFSDSAAVKLLAKDLLANEIAHAGEAVANCLNNGNKVLICGNGGSAADSQHFAAEFVNRFVRERKPLPCIALNTDSSIITAIANDYSFDEIFSKQVLALGNKDDIFIAISTSGNSKNILQAITAAKNRGLDIIALTGNDGGEIAKQLSNNDIELRVPSKITARIQETHILILHCLCEIVDEMPISC